LFGLDVAGSATMTTPPGPSDPAEFPPPGTEPVRFPDSELAPSVDVPPGATSRSELNPTPAVAPPEPPAGVDRKGKAQRTRVSGVWVAVIAGAVFLIVLIIFVAQNSRKTSVHFLGWSGHLSVALVILLSGVCGVLLAAVPGTIRILQLRRSVRRTAARLDPPLSPNSR
jgi:uncharacterized integral membrane protein